MHFTRADKNKAVAGLATGLALLALTSCDHPRPVAAVAPPPAPVGHTYQALVQVPPPVSPRIHFTASEEEQAQQAFNVIGLKSALMVAALSCGDQSQYDAFMSSFQPHILEEQHVMDAYFRKASGPYSGQKMEDSFVTLLANNQSVGGIDQRGTFCLNNAAEFTAVAALKTPEALDQFVTDRAPGELPGTTPMVKVATTVHHEYHGHAETHHEHVAVKHSSAKTESKVETKKVTATQS